MPAPVVIWIITGDRTSNAALCRYSVRARWEYFRNNSGIQTRLSKFQSRSQTRTTTTDDDDALTSSGNDESEEDLDEGGPSDA